MDTVSVKNSREMSLTETLADKPAYIGLLAASAVCIVLLGGYLMTALLDMPFDFVVPAGVLAAIAAIFAAVAIAISESSNGAGDDG